MRQAVRGMVAGWLDLDAKWRLAVVTSVLLLCPGVPAAGYWVSHRIEQGVIQNSARLAAIYMRSFVEPVLQELTRQSSLSPAVTQIIDGLFASAPLRDHVIRIEIRHRDGTVVYSKDAARLGTKAPMEPELIAAFAGEIQIELQDAHHDQGELERQANVPLYEIYTPLYNAGTNQVIGVAEFYQVADTLHAELRRARVQSWLMLGVLTTAMIAAFFKLLQRGSNQIAEQKDLLEVRAAEQSRLTVQNSDLRGRVEQAHRRGVEMNERSLRRIGADLHDGPAQLLGLALLKLDELGPMLKEPQDGGRSPRETLDLIRGATQEALGEIRNAAAGLVLPEIEMVTLAAALELAVKSHMQRTRMPVAYEIGSLPPHLPLPITICLFRFAQEGLNNAFRHAGGKGQSLKAVLEDTTIMVEVADEGAGFDAGGLQSRNDKMGLTGLRHRVESLGGSFEVISASGHGTRLIARFKNPLGVAGVQL